MVSHYGLGIFRHAAAPEGQAKVEAGVRFVQIYILGRLRRQAFFSRAEANQAIAGTVERIPAQIPALAPQPSQTALTCAYGRGDGC
jgi:hypothetical protein